jgi:hypothetical protein
LDSENCSCPLSQKPVQKRFLPQKGGSLSVGGVFAKKFRVREKIPLSTLAFGCSHALVPRRLRSRQPHSSLISGLLGVEAIWYPFKSLFGDKGVGQGAPLTPRNSRRRMAANNSERDRGQAHRSETAIRQRRNDTSPLGRASLKGALSFRKSTGSRLPRKPRRAVGRWR